MTDDEINGLVSELLRKRFDDFERSTVESEEDFDGSSVLRVTADFKKGELSAQQMIDTRHAIRSELLRRGEERFVFFDAVFPHEHDEVVEEDLE